MANSNVKPVFPSAVFPWVDKVDNQDIDFANDINSTVAEVESIETTLGTNPQNEAHPPVGVTVPYSTVSARITDAMGNAQLPYAALSASSANIPNTSVGQLVNFKVDLDSNGSFNGTDITIPVNGYWIVTAHVLWSWWNQGYSRHALTLNGSTNILDDRFVNWEFPGNSQPVLYSPSGQIVTGNPLTLVTPRWWVFGKRPINTTITWSGALHNGDRLSVYLENGTSNTSQQVTNLNLKACLIRTFPAGLTFGSE